MSTINFSKKLRSLNSHDGSDDEVSYNDSNGSYIDSEEDCEYQPSNKRTRTITNVSNNGIQRRPTRVPNLKIQNRNALLARENRKRKKEMMDSLEKTVDDLQTDNKKLLKMMKSKDDRTLKLEQEVRYLKSVIVNRTEIVSVLKSLPKFPSKIKDVADKSTGSGSETASCETFDDNDLDVDVATEWDEILRNPFTAATDFSDISKVDGIGMLSPASSPMSEISTEHNYFEKTSLMSNANEGSAGVCVHINSGRVSLEFCSTCHYNATNTWIERN